MGLSFVEIAKRDEQIIAFHKEGKKLKDIVILLKNKSSKYDLTKSRVQQIIKAKLYGSNA